MSGCCDVNIMKSHVCKHDINLLIATCYHCKSDARIELLEAQVALAFEQIKQKDKWLVELQKTVNKLQSIILLNGLDKMDNKNNESTINLEEILIYFLKSLRESLVKLEQSLKSVNEKDLAKVQFDWKLFKQILLAVMALLHSLCKMIPDENIRKILCGLIEALQAVINTLPG